MPVSNELRLFLSSTFVDFFAERDYLAKKLFPRLRSLCRDRGIEFTEIDLRWGLTDEDAEQGRILGTCFEEIDKSRPFFVGMLGDRYGWVPPAEELAKNSELSVQYPWIEQAVRDGKSATEMEFLHGFLNDPSAELSPLIYFRTPRGTTDERVLKLKEEVTSRLGVIPVFDSPEELAVMLEHDLLKQIEQYWPASKQHTWIEEERGGQAAFSQSRRKGYVANPTLVDALDAHLESPDSVLILTGGSGSGKSSLLAYWAETLREREWKDGKKPFIIEHFVGVTAASTDPDILVRRIIEEIRERIHSDEPVPQSSTELAQALPSWLGRISEERMIVLVDAINQFNTDGQFLHWLPDFSSANLKWVISSTESQALERLRSRGRALGHAWPEIPVTPISVNERERVLRTFLAGYQKKLLRSQEERIVSDEKSSSPLFLRTLLEELRLQGKHEDLDHLIDHYLASANIADLFKRILERLEVDYGRENVRFFLTRIWAAPLGLSESEVLASTPLDRAGLSVLLHAFDYHLVRLKGHLSFFHDHLRQGVEARYLPDQEHKAKAWTDLAAYFETAEASVTKAVSLPWLLHRAEAWAELEDTLLDSALLPYLTDGSRSYELLRYWVELEKQAENASELHSAATDHAGWKIDVVEKYQSNLRNIELATVDERQLRYGLALFFRNAGWPEGAVANAKRALELCDDSPDLFDFKIDVSLELGKAYLDRSELDNALETLGNALRLLGDNPASTVALTDFSLLHINIRNEYARLLEEQGKYKEAEVMSRLTLEVASKKFGANHTTTQNEMRKLADILAAQAKYVEAEALHRKVLQSIEASLGLESLEAGYYMNQLADFIRRFGGDYKEAEHLFERAIQIIEHRLGDKHPDLAILLQNYASLPTMTERWDEANVLFLRSLSILEAVYGPEHPALATSLNNYAAMLFWKQRYDEAEAPFRRALTIRQKVYGDHPVTAESYTNLGNNLRRQENYDGAEECYARALEIRLAILGPTHENTARTLHGYGMIMRIKGKLSQAEDFLTRSYAVRKASRGAAHRDTITTGIELAELFIEQSKPEFALTISEDILLAAGGEAGLPEEFRPRFHTILEKLEPHV